MDAMSDINKPFEVYKRLFSKSRGQTANPLAVMILALGESLRSKQEKEMTPTSPIVSSLECTVGLKK